MQNGLLLLLVLVIKCLVTCPPLRLLSLLHNILYKIRILRLQLPVPPGLHDSTQAEPWPGFCI